MGFVISELEKSDCNLIPLKKKAEAYHTQTMFAQLIEHLPKIKSEIEIDFTKDQSLIDKLILEYLAKNAKMDTCFHYMTGELDTDFKLKYEPTDEEDNETENDYDEAPTKYHLSFKSKETLQEKEDRTRHIVMKFLSYLESDESEGALYGEHS